MESGDPDGGGKTKRDDLVYPELSYRIVGALFKVHNEIGGGLLEKVYQRAVAIALREQNISFVEQVPFDISFRGESVGKQYLDFLIEDCIILELKQGDRFRKQSFDQVIAYLKSTGKKLAILVNFTRDEVISRRILNL